MPLRVPGAAGTPRIANRLLRRVRDFASVRGIAVVEARWWWKRWQCIV